jgi:predicted AlkP superfamily pyrophosphatase or phosphodiesterase
MAFDGAEHRGMHDTDVFPMSSLAPTISALLGIRAPASSQGHPLVEVVRTLDRGQRLCLIVVDSLGTALWNFHRTLMPCFSALAKTHCITLRAETPPLTSVNAATMMTGASPADHGVMNRKDKVNAETILHVMAQCSLSVALVGREKPSLRALFGQPSSFTAAYSKGPDARILECAAESMKVRRPDFLWVFFTDFDEISHTHGPYSEEAEEALAGTDSLLSELMGLLERYYYSTLIVADHGQHENPDHDAPLKGIHDGTTIDDFFVPLVWRGLTW